MVMDNEIIVTENKPSQIVKNAMEAAKELQRIVDSRNKKLILQGKQYLFFEDWQTLGRFDRTTAKVVDTKELYQDNKLIGFSAKAVALKDEIEISAAEAECCFDEPNWKNKPRFQLKSMAQTRACAKALRNCLAFIAVLANYEPTPAEEMIGDEDSGHHNNQPTIASKAKDEPASDKQIFLIDKQILDSHFLKNDETDRLREKVENGITKVEASKIISWWLGDSKKMVVGERIKRESREKEAKPTKADKIEQARDIVEGKLEVKDENKPFPDEKPGSSINNAIKFRGKAKATD